MAEPSEDRTPASPATSCEGSPQASRAGSRHASDAIHLADQAAARRAAHAISDAQARVRAALAEFSGTFMGCAPHATDALYLALRDTEDDLDAALVQARRIGGLERREPAIR